MNESVTEWQIFLNFVEAAAYSAFLLFFYSVIFGAALLLLGGFIGRLLIASGLSNSLKKPFSKIASWFQPIRLVVRNYGPFSGRRNEYLLMPIILAPVWVPVSYFILNETDVTEGGPGSGVGAVLGMVVAFLSFQTWVIREDKTLERYRKDSA
jgi:Na+-driven multidrug efflux pump